VRIGLFGGTFDPVHWGHLRLAEGAVRLLNLDELRWIPAQQPPHKTVGASSASPEDRAQMVALAIQGNPKFKLDRIELNRPPPSYTIDTVVELQRLHPSKESKWFFLVGSDLAKTLPTWKRIDELRERVTFVAIPRPGDSNEPLPLGVQRIAVDTIPVSSSEIRQLVREGRPVDHGVPPAVLRYMQEKKLYRRNCG
jgi:nicotinate-nucleotide adenylyltransferase